MKQKPVNDSDDLIYEFTKQFNEMVAGGKGYDEMINRERRESNREQML